VSVRPVVLLDASLLAIPNSAGTANQAEAILGRVIDWARCLHSHSAVRVAQLSDTADMLATLGYFPSEPNIRALLSMFALEHVYSVEDIRRPINALLERATPFLGVFGCEVLKPSTISTKPEILDKYEKPLRIAGARTLSSILSAALARRLDLRGLIFAALGLPSPNFDCLEIRCQVEEIQISGVCDHLHAPFSAYGEVNLAWSYEELLTNQSAAEVWKSAQDARDIHLAVALEVLGMLRKTTPGAQLTSIPEFHIGSCFYDSICRNKAGPKGGFADTVREACARVVLGAPKNLVKPFLIAKPGNRKKLQPAIRPDGSSGFRTHISKSHEGIRMMFWQRGDRSVEFANIGSKNELVIESGADEEKISRSW
jgi:hypothetical protein